MKVFYTFAVVWALASLILTLIGIYTWRHFWIAVGVIGIIGGLIRYVDRDEISRAKRRPWE